MTIDSDQAAIAAVPQDEFWLFGYGSLIWKPPPHFGFGRQGWSSPPFSRYHELPCLILTTGKQERRSTLTVAQLDTTRLLALFYSEDHRGTPEKPGRVVTLIERSFWASLVDAHDSAPDKVWGVAYRIAPDHVAEVKDYLDIREINGYSIHYTPFHPAATSSSKGSGEVDDGADADKKKPIRTLVYIGTPDNPQFMGPQDPQALAQHIHGSEGPSGLNRDYLLELERALDELSPESGDAHITDLSHRVRRIMEEDKTGTAP